MMEDRNYQVTLAVNCCLQREDGKMLFLLRQNTGYEDGHYGLPGGHVDPGETIVQAAIREIEEEVGVYVTAENLTLVQQHVRLGGAPYLNSLYICSEWEGEPFNSEPNVCAHLKWATVDGLDAPLMSHLAHSLKCLEAGIKESVLNDLEQEK